MNSLRILIMRISVLPTRPFKKYGSNRESMTSREKEEKQAQKNFNKAYVPTRSLTFFTVTAIMPIVFILALVLFVPIEIHS